jgi:mRNA interferase RelE/StbE
MFAILYHKLVWEQDFKFLNETERKKIIKYVSRRLTTYPEKYGKALIGDLKGYYRLSVENYRVIYKIRRAEITVYIVQVGFRRNAEVYVQAARKLGLL